ncbi:MAG TPA: hypothetical protein DCL48_16610 [Alphaproteobacteria bacterium]|nr:hypothetical protein [Alphaproteobacteria bacterium]
MAGLAGSFITLGANTLTTGGNNNTTSFSGTTSGAGGITKAGTGTFSTLGLANTGVNTVNAGTLNTNGAVAGSVVVNNGGIFSGNANIAGNLTVNAGGQLRPGNSPGITTVVGNYIGGGSIQVEVQFNNAGAPVNGTTHDFLNITGNVSNITTLNVVDFAPSGTPVATTGNGIEVVRVGGTTAANSFVLSGPVIRAGFEYLLAYRPNYSGALDGYFLQSASIQQVSLNAAILAAGRAGKGTCDTARGGRGGHPGLGGSTGTAWADASDGSFESNASNGLAFDADSSCYRAGVSAQDGNVVFGLSGGIGQTEADVYLAQGTATMDGDTTRIEGHVSYLRGGFFANASLGYMATDWAITRAAGAGVLGATVDGLIADAGVGYQTGLFGPASLTLLAEVNYDGTACGSDCLVVGAVETVSNWSAGVQARLDASFANGRIRPHLGIGFSSDLDGGHSVSFGGATTTVDALSGLVHADLGVEARVWKSLALYANGRWTDGLDSDSSATQARVGAKVSW